MKYCFLFLVLALVIIQYPCSADVVDDTTAGYEFITAKTNEDFTVSFYYTSGISHQDWIIPVQNLEGNNRYANISSFIQKTNFDTDEIENLQFFEYKSVPYTYTIDHYDHVNYSEWNETNQTWNNWTEQTLNWTETIESEKLDWKACKSNLFKSTGKELQDDYGEILIPKLGSKDKGDGTINGTKIFRVSYDTPITRMVNGWGSSGEFAMLVDDIRFCPWWSATWDRRRELVVDHNMVDADMVNFPVMVSITQLGLNANGNDTRITDSSDNQVAVDLECYSETSGELVFFFNGTSVSSTVDTSFWMYYNNSAATEPAADSKYGCQNVWDSDYVGVWHMNNDPSGSAPQLEDSTGNGYDGISGGAMTSDDLVDGDYGKSIDFDGSNDKFDLGNIANGLSTFSVTAKVYIDDHTVQRSFISKWWDGSNRAWDLEIETNVNKFAFRVSVDGSDTTGAICPDVITDAQWYIIKGVRTPTQTRIYVDGVLKNTQSLSGTTQSNNAHVTIGAQPRDTTGTAYWNFMDGKIGLVTIVNNEPTLNQITTEYNNLNNPTAAGTDPFFTSFGAEEEYVAPTPTPAPTTPASPAQYDELDFPLILYILTISMLYLLIAFKHGIAAAELSLIYLIFAFFFLLFQTITISVNYIYLTLFLLLFLISIAGITKQGAD